MAVLAVLCTAGMAAAQDNPMVEAIKAQHDMIKGNLVKSAAKVLRGGLRLQADAGGPQLR